jgi:hypothetical protein
VDSAAAHQSTAERSERLSMACVGVRRLVLISRRRNVDGRCIARITDDMRI